ncbi:MULTISPECIES: HAD-IIB family hydrolase [Alphaproteobacteria]|uniref:Mannosyl-3-phosphoglycerate phosphatase n=2 Tax=Alphaproteobacteria TaxID=28211 RepID=A0A512HLY7_9HYPH|nr:MULTISPECIES: HAD-IIB family hydrolase [Alphaproteobacteria]GEO86452.1 mannosyl-3-phosphoglycerate phosphatase [Ciceribacter naphthalenivorans]GLR22330.1 mannosyl-3-phosphoglycerate phosphatase [Ciceribacter naphthalenivorans]GLT05186.1 mannosyl-3-phosphoglycerate phosphatase [Sphingomonas psychrolutea]
MIVVFSDLDGTLLDHETYSFEPARPALRLLAESGIPLILASSKTEAEMRPIAREMGLDQPLIVENGAGIAYPETESAAEGGSHYEALRAMLHALPEPLCDLFRGFGDWTEQEVAQLTGLALEDARLAKDRRFSEPGLFSGSQDEKAEFLRLIADKGYQAIQGGRFFTVMPKTSKAQRMAEIAAHYAAETGAPVDIIALGDAPNDLEMLQTADTGVIIANPAHLALPVTERERTGHILRSDKAGPAGWNDMILRIVGAK